MWATLPFWSCAVTPGESVASRVTRWLEDGISVISLLVITVPEVPDVVSMSGTSAVTSTDCVVAPISSRLSICLLSPAWSSMAECSMTLNPGAVMLRR